jgi:hypothetical protein
MSSNNKTFTASPTPDTTLPIVTDSTIAAGNNDNLANIIFTIMTAIVFLGSIYLYYNLQDYLDLLHLTYPNYNFPEFKDYLIALLFIPVFTVFLLIIIGS